MKHTGECHACPWVGNANAPCGQCGDPSEIASHHGATVYSLESLHESGRDIVQSECAGESSPQSSFGRAVRMWLEAGEADPVCRMARLYLHRYHGARAPRKIQPADLVNVARLHACFADGEAEPGIRPPADQEAAFCFLLRVFLALDPIDLYIVIRRYFGEVDGAEDEHSFVTIGKHLHMTKQAVEQRLGNVIKRNTLLADLLPQRRWIGGYVCMSVEDQWPKRRRKAVHGRG